MKRRAQIKVVAMIMFLLAGTSLSAQNTIEQSIKQSAKVSAHLQEMVAHTATKDGQKSVSTLASLSIPCDAPAFFERHGCRMIDSIGRICHTDTYNAFGKGQGSPIDHFFVRNIEVKEFRILDGDYGVPYISDHYPIEIVIEL